MEAEVISTSTISAHVMRPLPSRLGRHKTGRHQDNKSTHQAQLSIRISSLTLMGLNCSWLRLSAQDWVTKHAQVSAAIEHLATWGPTWPQGLGVLILNQVTTQTVRNPNDIITQYLGANYFSWAKRPPWCRPVYWAKDTCTWPVHHWDI